MVMPVEDHTGWHAGEKIVKIIRAGVRDDRRKSTAIGVKRVMEKGKLLASHRLDDLVGPCRHDATNLGTYLRPSPFRVRGQQIIHPAGPWIGNPERTKFVVIAHHEMHASC